MSQAKNDTDSSLLMTALDFSVVELRVNQTGVMTDEQKDKLRRMRLGGIMLPAIFICMAGALVQAAIQAYSYSPSLLWQPIGACALLFAAIFFGVLRWLKISADLRAGRVASVTGSVTLEFGETRNVGYYGSGSRMKVEGVNFIIPFSARTAFLDGRIFRIYYVPNTRIILSAERHIH